MTSVPSSELRDRIAAAIARHGRAHPQSMDCECGRWVHDDDMADHKASVVLAEVQPEIDRLREEHHRALLASEESGRILQQQINEQAAELDRLRAELSGARVTIEHMSKAMSWISGHDRQGLDHLDEAQREARAREAAVRQAQRWATQAKSSTAELEQARADVERIRTRENEVRTARRQALRELEQARQQTAANDRALGVLLHYAAEAHRRKWAFDNGGEGRPSDAFTALHQLGNEIRASVDKLTAAQPSA